MNAMAQMADHMDKTDEVRLHPHFGVIGRAIDFLGQTYTEQPSLERVAQAAGMAPHHFQRVFTRWAGVSPKRYCQHLTLEHAKQVLERDAPVLEAAWDSGLSGGGRLHDLFVVAEAMTPGDYKKRGAGLTIRYGMVGSPFGPAMLAATDLGICFLGFAGGEDGADVLAQLRETWHASRLIEDAPALQQMADRLFDPLRAEAGPIALHIKGTNWQLKVWRALLAIPEGRVASYRSVAERVCTQRAARAVGQAVGANHIAYLIPCHRVIRTSGEITGYRWGTPYKRAILAFEASQADGRQAGAGKYA